MRFDSRLACGLILFSLAASAQTPAQPDESPAGSVDQLAGLWKAKRWFSLDSHGPLIIQRTSAGWIADFLGRTIPVHVDGEQFSFALPNGDGSFSGRLEQGGRRLAGHWISTGTPVSGSSSATPVTLSADGPDRLRGNVDPPPVHFTFYLMARKRPDGTLAVLLRNPERDYGAWLGVDRMTCDGNAVKLIGRRQGKEREVASGAYDADNDVITLTFADRGGSYDFRRDGDSSDFYPRGRHPGRYAYHPPLSRDDGWPTGTLDEADIDQAGIEKLIQIFLDAPMEQPETPTVHGLLIARHGKLVLEEYFHGEHRDELHETRSASKSVTAVIAGAAMQAGVPLQLSTHVYQIMNGGIFPPDLEPGKRAMTLEHLLTMSSGYYCDDNDEAAPGNEDAMLDQTDEPDYYRYTLKIPMATAPGDMAVYCSANANLALGVVGRAMGESPLDIFDRLVAVPMKINRYGWGLDPAGHPYGGGSVQFLPRDFMKFGQLLLNGGTWQDQRILSRDYAARATAPLYRLRGMYYGYLWWSIDYPYKARTVRAFFAGGTGGQAVIVIPELDLVIATYGGSYSSSGTFYVQMEITPRYLLPAVREAGDDKRAPVIPREDFAPKFNVSTESGRVTPP
jgi:CubicO group peptidase (beta-lactamase class C family)